jgi:hypothetical protein
MMRLSDVAFSEGGTLRVPLFHCRPFQLVRTGHDWNGTKLLIIAYVLSNK